MMDIITGRAPPPALSHRRPSKTLRLLRFFESAPSRHLPAILLQHLQKFRCFLCLSL